MKPTRHSDPLLRGTRFLLVVTMVLAAVAGVLMLAAIPSVWIFSGRVVVEANNNGIALDGQHAMMTVSGLLGLGIVLVSLSFFFLRKLVAIIDTVAQGSPFIPENTTRLRTMGWLALAFQALLLLATPGTLLLSRALPKSHIEVSGNLGALIVALLLFILARVFDHGVRLEQDIEGTV